MYIQSNTELRSRNHCCHGKAVSITHFNQGHPLRLNSKSKTKCLKLLSKNNCVYILVFYKMLYLYTAVF